MWVKNTDSWTESFGEEAGRSADVEVTPKATSNSTLNVTKPICDMTRSESRWDEGMVAAWACDNGVGSDDWDVGRTPDFPA